MAQLALHALTGFLSLVYIAMGVIKLFPVSQQMAFAVQFRCMLYASVFPSAWLGYTPDDALYRIMTGTFEFSCGLAMLSWDRELRLGGCGVLVAIMALMIWSGLALGDYFFTRSFQAYAKVCPTVLFGYIPEPQKYHMTIGIWEACCGLALLIGDRELKQGASGILLVIMGVMITSNVIIKDYSTMFFFAMHFLFLSFLFAKYRRRSIPLKTEEEENFKKE